MPEETRKRARFSNNVDPVPISGNDKQTTFECRRRSGRLRSLSISNTLQPKDSNVGRDGLGIECMSNTSSEQFDPLSVSLVPGDENNTIEGLFSDVFNDAILTKVEVEQCVSLPELRVRPLHNFGIQRAMHVLRGESIGSVTGYVCVGKFPVIAELPPEYRPRILDYFCTKGRDRESSLRFIQSHAIFQVVNGGYEHEGRWRLIDSSGYQFTGIEWRVVRIPWQDPKVLRAISMMSSQIQKRDHVVELSFMDEMVHLRRIIDEYVLENGVELEEGKPLPRGFCKTISSIFNGGKDYSSNTIRHLISVSSKMSMNTAVMMRNVIDEECPGIARTKQRKDSSDTNVAHSDTRVFRALLNSKTLRGAKLFFAGQTSDEDRENTMHRLRYIAQENGRFKGVTSATLDAQVKSAIAGRKAIEHFRVRIVGKDLLPTAMRPLIQNMLRTTKLDSEIEDNLDEQDGLLPTLKLKYMACAGAEGGQRVELYERFVANHNQDVGSSASPASNPEASAIADTSETPLEAEADTNCDTKNDQSKLNKSEGDGEIHLHIDRSFTVDENEDRLEVESAGGPDEEPELDPLEQHNVELYNLTWEDYNRTVLTEQEVFDLVISDPFQKAAAGNAPVIDSDRRVGFTQFVKKVLVPGGYVFLIVPQLEISAWMNTFAEFNFKTESVFTLVKDQESVQRLKGRSFQNLVEVAVVAKKGGRHPSRFVMDVSSPYTQLPHNTYQRKAPVIDHIGPPPGRLFFPASKTMVRTGEKSPALLWELMKTFCRSGGTVLDPFGGTLTTGIACVQSGRSCVLLEADEECLSLGRDRLRELAREKIKQEQFCNTLLEFNQGNGDVVDLARVVENGETRTKNAEKESPSNSSLTLTHFQNNQESSFCDSNAVDRDSRGSGTVDKNMRDTPEADSASTADANDENEVMTDLSTIRDRPGTSEGSLIRADHKRKKCPIASEDTTGKSRPRRCRRKNYRYT